VNLIHALLDAATMLARLIESEALDEDLSDDELIQLSDALNAVQAAIECEQAQRNEARSVASEQHQARMEV
jgi:hypothetical protein